MCWHLVPSHEHKLVHDVEDLGELWRRALFRVITDRMGGISMATSE